MSDEWTSCCTTSNGAKYWSLNLQEVTAVQILTNRLYDISTSHKGIHNLRVHDEINIALAITDFSIGKTMELLRQRTKRLGEKIKIINSYSQLATAGTENMSLDTDDITNIQQLELGILFLTQYIKLEINLYTAAAIHQYGEASLAMPSNSHQTSGNGNLLITFSLTLKASKLLQDLSCMMRYFKAMTERSHTLCLKSCQLIAANL